jgi:predicted MFS family arabinose efflux permease
MTSATVEATPTRSLHVFITGLGIAQIASWGSLYYSFPQIAAAMAAELGYSKSSLYGAASIGILLCGLAAYPVGAAIDRGHGRWIMTGGSVVAGLLLLAWSQVDSLLPYYFILAGIGALQAATLYEPAFAVVARRFGAPDARRGITALTLWGGFASTVFIPLVELLLQSVGWRGALVVLGLVNLLLCTGLYGWLIDARVDATPAVARGAAAAEPSSRAPLRYAARMPVFWMLLVSLTAHAAMFSVITFHFYPILLERGLPAATVVLALAVFGPAQVAGRVVVRACAPQASARTLGAVVVLGFPAALALLAQVPVSAVVAMAVAGLYGAANGVMTIVRGMVVPDMISHHGYGAINGALTAPSMMARALAPVAAAALWAASGSYDAVIVATLVVTILLAVSFWAAVIWSGLGRRTPAGRR